jgi:hypothetical protein
MSKRDGSSLPVLGWKEIVELPDWGIVDLKVKLDTGAKTSALHIENLVEVGPGSTDADLPVVRFEVPLTRLDDGPRVEVTAPVVAYRSIRDTRARPELRPVVRTRLRCATIDEVIEVTLTRRSGMLFRMILGRRALRGHAVVDPGRIFTTAPRGVSRARMDRPRS